MQKKSRNKQTNKAQKTCDIHRQRCPIEVYEEVINRCCNLRRWDSKTHLWDVRIQLCLLCQALRLLQGLLNVGHCWGARARLLWRNVNVCCCCFSGFDSSTWTTAFVLGGPKQACALAVKSFHCQGWSLMGSSFKDGLNKSVAKEAADSLPHSH